MLVNTGQIAYIISQETTADSRVSKLVTYGIICRYFELCTKYPAFLHITCTAPLQ